MITITPEQYKGITAKIDEWERKNIWNFNDDTISGRVGNIKININKMVIKNEPVYRVLFFQSICYDSPGKTGQIFFDNSPEGVWYVTYEQVYKSALPLVVPAAKKQVSDSVVLEEISKILDE